MKKILALTALALFGAFAFAADPDTTTTTSTGNGFSASSDASAIYYNKTWGTGTHITETLDFLDFGATKANHVYIEGHEIIATTAGFNIYAGGIGVEPDLSALFKKTNIGTSNLGVEIYAAIGNGIPTNGSSHVSEIAGGQFKYKATSALTWNALQGAVIRIGSQNGYSISTGLSFIFGK